MSRIGVLAVQGAFIEHEKVLTNLGAECFEIRKPSDLDRNPDALVIPGGESTVMAKLLGDMGMTDRIRGMVSGGMPVLGTCAGMILLASGVEGGEPCLGTLPMTVRRNAYGRQLGSFSSVADFAGLGEVPLRFIRAPSVVSIGDGTGALCSLDGVPVAVHNGRQIATAFHPELTGDVRVHGYFLDLVRGLTAFIRGARMGADMEQNGSEWLYEPSRRYMDCASPDFDPKRAEALAERAFVRELDGGCSSPIAAFAQASGEEVLLTGLYYHEEQQAYVTGNKLKSVAAGKMGYSTSEVGDLVVENL